MSQNPPRHLTTLLIFFKFKLNFKSITFVTFRLPNATHWRFIDDNEDITLGDDRAIFLIQLSYLHNWEPQKKNQICD